MRGKRRPPPELPTEAMARAVITDAQGEYSEEEKARVRDTLDNRPTDLARVLAEIHGAHEEGGAE